MSGTRPHIDHFPAIVSGDMSANITSRVTIMQLLTGATYQISWSGTTPVGDLYLQGSNDYKLNQDGSVQNSGTWTNMYLSLNGGAPAASVAISGNTGSGIIEIERTNIYAVRLFYDFGSGVGTLNAKLCAKVA